jgi:hypothetical protein
MKLLAMAIAMSVSTPAPAAVADASPHSQPLQLRPKAGVAQVAGTGPVLLAKVAPFVNSAGNPSAVSEPALELASPKSQTAQPKPGCSKSASLCYDTDSGRIVFKPARQFMPEIPGLQRENISIKRDRIIFRYSF